MDLLAPFRHLLAVESMQPARMLTSSSSEYPTLAQQTARATRQSADRPWRSASITEALGVPAIQRAVTLIANTVGRLPVQTFRDGAPMSDIPRVIVRPDPFRTPQAFYRDCGYLLASRGEVVWWIARRDGDGLPAALVIVPPAELSVSLNSANRMLPDVQWGTVRSTWYSPANPTGDFVQVTYLQEPGDLRGKGPLQMNAAAISVAVEAQEWAANFYADGGSGGTWIKAATELGDDPVTGESEADRLREQWVGVPNNMPRVTDPMIESVQQIGVDVPAAQMLEGRNHQNGEAARMFGIPGALLEFAQSGTSLTYQNVESVWRQFQEGCLTPNYLTPLEQALSDLLTRSTIAKFYTKELLKADVKTRFEVYGLGISNGIFDAVTAAKEEGYQPGGVPFTPTPPAQPSAVPSSIPSILSGGVRCPTCDRVLAEVASPPYRFHCPRCKTLVAA